MTLNTIEDIILDRDKRGVAPLRAHLPNGYTEEAAKLILDHPGTAVIVTGFYILTAQAPETDGPPGAIAIGNALQSLGYKVVYVTDKHSHALMTGLLGKKAEVIEFPIAGHEESKKFAAKVVKDLKPSILISIERCGLTKDGVFLNMRGRDISEFNAKIDYLFSDFPHSVGIGDGGNEIGMGNLAKEIPGYPFMPSSPCVTKVSKLIVTSVSNWGGYGLVTAISRLKKKNLLISLKDEEDLVKKCVELGAVDGPGATRVNQVDGFTLEENSLTVKRLHELLTKEGIRYSGHGSIRRLRRF